MKKTRLGTERVASLAHLAQAPPTVSTSFDLTPGPLTDASPASSQFCQLDSSSDDASFFAFTAASS
jgi:hypothetical protein